MGSVEAGTPEQFLQRAGAAHGDGAGFFKSSCEPQVIEEECVNLVTHACQCAGIFESQECVPAYRAIVLEQKDFHIHPDFRVYPFRLWARTV